MKDLTRRRFLANGSLGVALAGIAAFVPLLSGALKLPIVAPKGVRPGNVARGPLVAHVRDLATGEIAFLVGSERFVIRDPELAVRLHTAARSR
jgi:hypothetical protein